MDTIPSHSLDAGFNHTVDDTHQHDSLLNVGEAVSSACKRIAPMWDLSNFVAVNPYWGVREKEFIQGAHFMERVFNSSTLMPATYYRDKFKAGQFSESDVQQAVTLYQSSHISCFSQHPEFSVAKIVEWLNASSGHPTLTEQIFSLLESIDITLNTTWSQSILDEISKFLSLYFDEGEISWGNPFAETSLYAAWLSYASVSRSLDVRHGVKISKCIHTLPRDYQELYRLYAREVGVDIQKLELLFARELATLKGWASFLQHHDFEYSKHGEPYHYVEQLLAIKIGFSLCIARSMHEESWKGLLRNSIPSEDDAALPSLDLLQRYICQSAMELSHVLSVSASIKARSTADSLARSQISRAEFQSVFCIDVRSEVFRRHLEGQSPHYRTYGFAGFFGLPLSFTPHSAPREVAQYPVLLKSAFRVRERFDTNLARKSEARRSVTDFLTSLRSSLAGGFNYVESFGGLYALSFLRTELRKIRGYNTLVAHTHDRNGSKLSIELSLSSRVEYAKALLKNTALSRPYAPWVLLCGHSAKVTNNPYQSGYECGACGGHGGGVNAQVAAEILNDVEVRAVLAPSEWSIPEDTKFISGVHITTTDEIILSCQYQSDLPPHITHALKRASDTTRRERIERFSITTRRDGKEISTAESRISLLQRKSQDWSEVRPEWGLARNSLFIAAPRELTRGVDLSGRAFLHEYDPSSDSTGDLLEQILTAPVVVASWINLQYYASTVSPREFGAGDKIFHNVVGKFGILSGGDGDLQVGLPLQAVHDGEHPVHEPLRLSVIVDAPMDRLSAIVDQNVLLRDLIYNEWIHLYRLTPDGCLYRLTSPGQSIALNLTMSDS